MRIPLRALALMALSSGLLPVVAHNGTSNYSTSAQTITISGTVTESVWANPHASLLFDVQDDKGAICTGRAK
jgi:hypothetical protein